MQPAATPIRRYPDWPKSNGKLTVMAAGSVALTIGTRPPSANRIIATKRRNIDMCALPRFLSQYHWICSCAWSSTYRCNRESEFSTSASFQESLERSMDGEAMAIQSIRHSASALDLFQEYGKAAPGRCRL